jgi:hypothetical protein
LSLDAGNAGNVGNPTRLATPLSILQSLASIGEMAQRSELRSGGDLTILVSKDREITENLGPLLFPS